MIFRTLLFFVVMYFLVKVISRFFLPSDNKQRGRRGTNVFYKIYQQYAQQNQQQNRNRSSSGNTEKNTRRFEEIEEAEFEEITDEEESTSKTSE